MADYYLCSSGEAGDIRDALALYWPYHQVLVLVVMVLVVVVEIVLLAVVGMVMEMMM